MRYVVGVLEPFDFFRQVFHRDLNSRGRLINRPPHYKTTLALLMPTYHGSSRRDVLIRRIREAIAKNLVKKDDGCRPTKLAYGRLGVTRLYRVIVQALMDRACTNNPNVFLGGGTTGHGWCLYSGNQVLSQ
jgi:hypothetical protein